MSNDVHGEALDPTDGTDMLGLAGMLRLWRAEAGRKLGRDRPLSQQEVADECQISPRWYGELERGAQSRLKADKVDKLAEVLMLEGAAREALYFYTVGSVPQNGPVQLPTGQADRYLQMLLDHHMPRPAYISDASWNIIAYNAAMAEWFPWVKEPDANLMLWALLHPDAREQLLGWEGHVKTYLAMIRRALAARKKDPALTALLRKVLKDEQVRSIYNDVRERTRLVSYRDGDRFRLHIKRFDHQDLDVISHVFIPANYLDLRFVVITWLGSEESPAIPDGLRWVRDLDTPPQTPMPLLTADASPYMNVDGRADIEHLVGDDSMPLPALARSLGPGHLLYLVHGDDSTTPSVVQGTRQSNGTWDIHDLDLATALRRLCPGGPAPAPAGLEYRAILRAYLPSEPVAASAALDKLISCVQDQLLMYTTLRSELLDTRDAA